MPRRCFPASNFTKPTSVGFKLFSHPLKSSKDSDSSGVLFFYRLEGTLWWFDFLFMPWDIAQIGTKSALLSYRSWDRRWVCFYFQELPFHHHQPEVCRGGGALSLLTGLIFWHTFIRNQSFVSFDWQWDGQSWGGGSAVKRMFCSYIEPSSGPRTHTGRLTTACSSSPREVMPRASLGTC